MPVDPEIPYPSADFRPGQGHEKKTQICQWHLAFIVHKNHKKTWDFSNGVGLANREV